MEKEDNQGRGRREGEYNQGILYPYENGIMQPTKIFKRREEEGG
jgi:hypothetical protein